MGHLKISDNQSVECPLCCTSIAQIPSDKVPTAFTSIT